MDPPTRPSPLPNRAAPDGTLHAVPARGLMMGNRGGRLHRADFGLGAARWRSRAWICCLTAFRGRRRAVMGEGYTEIFFLDEATALAAGHRPCFECRRAAARAYAEAWARAEGHGLPPRAAEIDAALHRERLTPPEPARFAELASGAIFRTADGCFLKTPGGALAWSFEGYRPAPAPSPETLVAALTPARSRAALAAGYRPLLHPSAAALN